MALERPRRRVRRLRAARLLHLLRAAADARLPAGALLHDHVRRQHRRDARAAPNAKGVGVAVVRLEGAEEEGGGGGRHLQVARRRPRRHPEDGGPLVRAGHAAKGGVPHVVLAPQHRRRLRGVLPPRQFGQGARAPRRVLPRLPVRARDIRVRRRPGGDRAGAARLEPVRGAPRRRERHHLPVRRRLGAVGDPRVPQAAGVLGGFWLARLPRREGVRPAAQPELRCAPRPRAPLARPPPPGPGVDQRPAATPLPRQGLHPRQEHRLPQSGRQGACHPRHRQPPPPPPPPLTRR